MVEVVRGMNFLIDQGLAFYWGTSEWTAQMIEVRLAVAAAELCHPSDLSLSSPVVTSQ